MSNEQTIKTAINYLKEHPFSVIQLSDKEKFHTGMLCFTLNKYPSLFKTIFKLDSENYEALVEEKSVDLLIREKEEDKVGKIRIIVESKFKTGLHKSRTPKGLEGEGEFVSQLKKIKHTTPCDDYYLLSLFPEIEKNEFKGIQFTKEILSSLQKLEIDVVDVSEEDSLIILWVEYLKQLKVIVDYFIESEMNCINLTKSVLPDDSSLSDLLKGIKLNGVFESYRYGLVQQKVEKKLSDEIKKSLKKSCINRNELEQVGELFNSHGNGGVHYALAMKEKTKSYGVQWQGALKLFIETENKSNKDGVKIIYKKLLGDESLKEPSLGKFSSITIKNDWNIYEDINDKPEEIVDYLNKLNQKEIKAIVENEK